MIALIEFIKAIPTIITFFFQVKKWIEKEKDVTLRKDALQGATDAFKKAHETGDSSAIENLFKPNIK